MSGNTFQSHAHCQWKRGVWSNIRTVSLCVAVVLLFVIPLPVHRFSSVLGCSVTAITAESKQLAEWQDLFELYVSDYLALQRCGEELLHLKAMWDMVGAVMYTFSDW